MKKLDLRHRLEPGPLYFVVLCARKSEPWGPGHAFVVWGAQTPDGRFAEVNACGFYPPLEQGLLNVLFGDGVMADESTRPASTKPYLLTHRLICCVDRETYLNTLEAKRQWQQGRYNYNLFTRNCTHFAHRIASAMGLTSSQPKLCECPSDYLARLIEQQ